MDSGQWKANLEATFAATRANTSDCVAANAKSKVSLCRQASIEGLRDTDQFHGKIVNLADAPRRGSIVEANKSLVLSSFGGENKSEHNKASIRRKLLAVLIADVSGYSRLVELDDLGTYRRMQFLRHRLLEPVTAIHGGHVVRYNGDGALITFDSCVRAVECAIRIQVLSRKFDRSCPSGLRMRLRIGIDVDDVVVAGDDIYGRGVNVAARLEARAEPGGVLISGSVYQNIYGRISSGCESMGRCQLKNISKPIHIYRVAADEFVPSQSSEIDST